MEYALHIIVLVEVFAILAVSFDLAAGQAGLLSLSHAAFFGIGAYAAALMALHGSTQYPLVVGLAIVVSAAGSLLVSLSSIRLHGDYFLIGTFGFQLIVFSILNNWTGVTGGPSGLPAIPAPRVGAVELSSAWQYVAVGAIQLVVVCAVVWRIITRPIGRVLRAIRTDELFARSLGKDTVRFKISIFAVSAGLAGSAGALYAFFAAYVDPTSFTILDSVLVLSMVLIGGSGTIYGPVIGAAALVVLPEVLREIGIPGDRAANVREILYGCALILTMLFRPKGIAGTYGYETASRPAP